MTISSVGFQTSPLFIFSNNSLKNSSREGSFSERNFSVVDLDENIETDDFILPHLGNRVPGDPPLFQPIRSCSFSRQSAISNADRKILFSIRTSRKHIFIIRNEHRSCQSKCFRSRSRQRKEQPQIELYLYTLTARNTTGKSYPSRLNIQSQTLVEALG